MSYQIRYTDTSMVKQDKKIRKPRVKLVILVCSVLLLVGLLQIKSVQNFLIPGDPEVTKAAFTSFTQELRAGERLGDAITTFCRQVIESDTLE